jgi:hypothetical protein
MPPVNFCSDENIQTIFGTKIFETIGQITIQYHKLWKKL